MTENDNYPPEYRAADARIALAMGWLCMTWPDGDREAWSTDLWETRQPDPPRFHSDIDASRALLEWLAVDGMRWKTFMQKLCDSLGVCFEAKFSLFPIAILMTAKPQQIAQAADAMLKEMEK